ncbi:bifunctional diguanylate cyclase/phosphodiesterase [Paenibacillus sp. TRM 82003]|uniref:putative bifunctional diguanylate cyclase/phosphodiesterase n=1 Tax=Kineococcus sp. TRM81007 TaxID=2925831 RepID=UPI001F5AD6B9|nr:bifunctional diguanylate cyclase/phosphodiesterase [Kineococcus sp. TRM81007]MCI2239340.1 bifunctional diguanylate cyclase/phosphodiesterase [Kineococcus sp. TRM81007]MCI3925024.1 bifunctional diguanylate cyclase/phosphodiesterase [Paenibacillus sp. TRM 82003]
MTSHRAARSARLTWSLLAGVLLAAGAVLVVPGWRPAAVVATSAGSVLLVVAGAVLHRPRGAAWWLVAVMLALWGSGALLVQVHGHATAAANATVSAGQAVAAGIVVHVARRRAGDREPSPGGRLDLLVTVAVLALAGAQVLAALLNGRGDVSGVVVATVDVAVLAVLLRFTASRRALPVSSWLLLVAAALTIAYDLSCALHGHRLALPDEPLQSLGVLSLGLFGLAAVHPTMTSAFEARTFTRRRSPSAALLGLLPLVAVPAALWWVARTRGAPGLPDWTIPVTGAIVAALCLLRARAALRASEHLAEHDPLTDLANRRGLARAHGERAPAGGRSLLLLDLDDFKQVNDTHGHDVGDALLLQVRDRLVAATREVAGAAGAVARLGGDEFTVLVPTACAAAVADHLLRALAAPVPVEDLRLRTGASVGIAHEETSGPVPLAELITRADVAMYAAKSGGGSRAVSYHPAMREEVARRYTLSGQLRRLLSGRAAGVGHLEVHYQPLVDLASGRATGAEALVRWFHPEHGLLAPADFLALVRSNDLDAQLDTAVLEGVVQQLARWRDQGRRALPVAVNLTRTSLDDPDLAGRVLTLLAAADVPAHLLHLEITEHEQLPLDSPAARTLTRLHAAGVEVHLDDYGTGYTALDYLRRFPVQVIKVDRSVVVGVVEGDGQLVAGVLAMAGALGLRVLAEGIETPEQRARLVELGVQQGQGYLFSRPLPAAAYADRVLGPVRPRREDPTPPPVLGGAAVRPVSSPAPSPRG